MTFYFGWRRSMLGKPTCYKANYRQEVTTKHSIADPNYPYLEAFVITEEEYNLPLDVLVRKYPLRISDK